MRFPELAILLILPPPLRRCSVHLRNKDAAEMRADTESAGKRSGGNRPVNCGCHKQLHRVPNSDVEDVSHDTLIVSGKAVRQRTRRAVELPGNLHPDCQ